MRSTEVEEERIWLKIREAVWPVSERCEQGCREKVWGPQAHYSSETIHK